MRIRNLLGAAVLTGGLVAIAATPALASPSQLSGPASSCTLTVSNLYYSIGMQTAAARLSGGCSGTIDITLQQGTSAAGPFQDNPDALYNLQQSADGTAATAYFMDPEQRGYCRAKATYAGLTAVSASPSPC